MFSPDGTRIMTGSGDNTARIYDSRPFAVSIRERDAALAAAKAKSP